MMDSRRRRRRRRNAVEANRWYDRNKSSAEKLSNSNCFNMLNDSVLMEILSRLSCREATRFKSVCKQWNTVISSDYFITLFYHRRHDQAESQSPSSYRLILDYWYKFRDVRTGFSLVVHCGPNGSVLRRQKLDLSFLQCHSQCRLRENASFGDLILCSCSKNTKSTNLYLCNPQTKQSVRLYYEYITGLLCVPSPCSVCHHGNRGGVINNKFKFTVVLIPKGRAFKPVTQIEVLLFSSDEGRWRDHVVSSPQRLTDEHQGNVVAYKGKLHWFHYPYVLVYDPYEDPDRISRVIELENNYSYPIECPIVQSIAVFHDRLRIAYSARDRQLFPPKYHQVWELKDYDVRMWRLVHEVRYSNLCPEEGHVLHDGNAIYLGKSRWGVCGLRNGVVDKDHSYMLAPGIHDLSSCVINVHQIADLLPSPLPSFEW